MFYNNKMKKFPVIFVLLFISAFSFAGDFTFQNRLQLDAAGKTSEGRVRLDMNHSWTNGNYYIPFEIKAYTLFTPVDFLSVGAGNSFFKKCPVRAAYLSASDDYLKTGRLLKSGFGIMGNIPFSEDTKLSLSASISPNEWNDDSEVETGYSPAKIDINLGTDFILADKFSLGGAVNKINGTELQAGIYAGYKEKTDSGNFLLNAGYVYNFRDSFMEKTQHALMISLGYKINAIDLGFYADFITGLNSNYLKKSGKIKTYDNGQVPYYGAFAVVYNGLEKWEMALRSHIAGFTSFGVTCESEYNISKKAGSVSLEAGIEYDGSQISGEVSLGWKMKVSGK